MSSEAAAYGTEAAAPGTSGGRKTDEPSGGRRTGEAGVDLRVSRSVDLLLALKHTVADFAKREETLARELLSRRGTANRKHRDGMEKTEARLATQTAETEAHFKREEERVNTICAARRCCAAVSFDRRKSIGTPGFTASPNGSLMACCTCTT